MGIKLTLPAAESVAPQKTGVVITIDNKQRLFLEKDRVSEAGLRQKIARLVEQDKKLQVVVQAHHLTPYSMVLRVLDEVRLGGCFDIVLEAKKKPETKG